MSEGPRESKLSSHNRIAAPGANKLLFVSLNFEASLPSTAERPGESSRQLFLVKFELGPSSVQRAVNGEMI